MTIRHLCAAVAVVWLAGGQPARGQATPETVVDGLDHPCGLAIQPKTGHVFVAESGAGRVIRIVDGQARTVIAGFPREQFGTNPEYAIGPLGLAFLNTSTLLVGGGGLADGEELLGIYQVPEDDAEAIAADAMTTAHRLPATDQEKGEGDFHGVVVTGGAVFVTCNGDDDKGWIAKADVVEETVGPLRRFLSTKQQRQTVNAPVAITNMPKQGHLVVGQMGGLTAEKDGVLSFYHAVSGKPLLTLATGLRDVTGLAYSPHTGLLYATDFAWANSTEGGLFRLDARRQTTGQVIVPKKVVELDRPTALAFADDGTLYVTTFGPTTGKLLRIAPEL